MATEKRLIDANELMDEMSATFQQCVFEGCESEECQIALETIMEAPTVDAVEVVHGRWIGVDSSYWKWKPDGGHMVEHITYRCSECARKSVIRTSYCPNCGARMDGDGNGNE